MSVIVSSASPSGERPNSAAWNVHAVRYAIVWFKWASFTNRSVRSGRTVWQCSATSDIGTVAASFFAANAAMRRAFASTGSRSGAVSSVFACCVSGVVSYGTVRPPCALISAANRGAYSR